MTLEATWLDAGREPKHPPNPAYPNGMDVDLSDGRTPSCSRILDHPTARCGVWMIECSRCGFTAAITTAGRPDDPRWVRVPCKGVGR